jgi:pyruvate kinase/tRNA A-37 threonylcarbamoyl transferase component Bud32
MPNASQKTTASIDLEPTEDYFEPGKVISHRFAIKRLAGTGAQGAVYEATDRRLDKTIALKFRRSPAKSGNTREWEINDRMSKEAFLREAKNSMKVTHRNICRIFDVGQCEDGEYISMEFIENNLQNLLRNLRGKGKTLRIDQVRVIGQRICSGLEAIHRCGLCHQDLKPANILLDSDNQVKISDLGLAGTTLHGFTTQYAAPEILMHLGSPGKVSANVSTQSDLYSLGAVLYEMITGRKTAEQISAGLNRDSLQALEESLGNIHPAIRETIIKCLDPSPPCRPTSVKEVANVLADGTLPEVMLFNTRAHGKDAANLEVPLLRTKLIATINERGSYRDGLVLADDSELSETELNDEYFVFRLTERMANSGVDALRLNASSMKDLARVRSTFIQMRDAILIREQRLADVKRIAILIDLPGPQLSLNLDTTELREGEDLIIYLDETNAERCTLLLDSKPLRTALDEIEQESSSVYDSDFLLQSAKDSTRKRTKDESPESDVENILGIRYSSEKIFDDFVDSLEKVIRRSKNSKDEALKDRGGTKEAKIYIDKGLAVLEVNKIIKDPLCLQCRVVAVNGSGPRDQPEVAFRAIDLSIPAFTHNDRRILDELLEIDMRDGPDNQVLAFVGLSFAQTTDDVLRLKYYLEKKWGEFFAASGSVKSDPAHRHDSWRLPQVQAPSVIAKIETPKGWRNRNYILDVADGLMIARADLGFREQLAWVPEIQKRLTSLGKQRGKIVITATHMLSSMTQSMEPTRAELADIFNAIQDGADALLLCDETSHGRYPFHAVATVLQVADRAERYFEYANFDHEPTRRERQRNRLLNYLHDDSRRIGINAGRLELGRSLLLQFLTHFRLKGEQSADIALPHDELEWRYRLYDQKSEKARKQEITNRITESTCLLAEAPGVAAIVTASRSGRTARMVTRMRPRVVVIATAHDQINARKLTISYGVISFCIGETAPGIPTRPRESLFRRSADAILSNRRFRKWLDGKLVIFTSGSPQGRPGTTNSIQARVLKRRR